jgi:hypothetical protein
VRANETELVLSLCTRSVHWQLLHNSSCDGCRRADVAQTEWLDSIVGSPQSVAGSNEIYLHKGALRTE